MTNARAAALALCAAILISLELYYPAVSGGFVFDDLALPFRKSIAHEPLSVWISGVRPVLMFSYWLNYSLSGTEPAAYHITNSITHALNSFLVFLVMAKLLDLAGWAPRRAIWTASAGAMLFLVHPLQTEAVSYIAGRSESLAAFFSLCAYGAFLYLGGKGLSWKASALILALFGMAAATKENSVALIGIFALTDVFWPRPFCIAGLRRNWRLYALLLPAGAAALAFVLKTLANSGNSAGFSVAGVSWYQYGFTEARALFKYVTMFVVPLGQCVDHDFPVSRAITDHGAVFYLAGIAVVIAATLRFRKRYPLAVFGLFFFLILLMPTSSIVPLADPFAERRMYLPVLGLILAGCHAASFLNRETVSWLLPAVVLFCSVLTFERNQQWGDSFGFWIANMEQAPGKARIYGNLADTAVESRRCPEALPYLTRVEPKFARDPVFHVALAKLLECVGRPGEAVPHLQRAVALSPDALHYQFIGLLYGEMGKMQEAGEALRKAVALNPNSTGAQDALALWYESTNQPESAAEHYRRSLGIDRHNRIARLGLARVQQNRPN